MNDLIIIHCKSGKVGIYPEHICTECPDENWNTVVCICGEKSALSNPFSCWGHYRFYCNNCRPTRWKQIHKILDVADDVEKAEADIRDLVRAWNK